MDKTYNVGDHLLTMRDKATFFQVRRGMELMAEMGISETSTQFEIFQKLGDKLPELMQVVFDNQPELVETIDWQQVEFDTIAEALQDFLSSSDQLKQLWS